MTQPRFQRRTRQREVILEELRKLKSHPTAAGIYELVRQRLPKISLGTVYRNLELMAEMGVVQKLDLGGSEARFDGDVSPHAHIRCVRCGRVDDVEMPSLEGFQGKQDDCHGYDVLGCRLELLGVCRQCRTDQAPKHDRTDGERPDDPRSPTGEN